MLRDYLASKGCFYESWEFCPVTGALSPAAEFERLESLRVADVERGYSFPVRPPSPPADMSPPW